MKTSTNIGYALKFEELVFANRNKNYGAFVLRRSYNKNLVIACAVAILIILAVVLTQDYTKQSREINLDRTKTTTVVMGTPPIDKPEQVIIEKTQAVPLQTTIKFTPPVVVEDALAPDAAMPTIDDLVEATPWIRSAEGNEGGVDITYIESPPAIEKQPEEVPEQIHIAVEEMPAYAEGNEALMRFISANLKYPELARKAGIEGRVYIYFIVNRDGTISNPELAKGIGGGCDEEALRVIKLLGKWIPGKQNGKPVKVKMAIPIVFKLN
jgi:protein TonB